MDHLTCAVFYGLPDETQLKASNCLLQLLTLCIHWSEPFLWTQWSLQQVVNLKCFVRTVLVGQGRIQKGGFES